MQSVLEQGAQPEGSLHEARLATVAVIAPPITLRPFYGIPCKSTSIMLRKAINATPCAFPAKHGLANGDSGS